MVIDDDRWSHRKGVRGVDATTPPFFEAFAISFVSIGRGSREASTICAGVFMKDGGIEVIGIIDSVMRSID